MNRAHVPNITPNTGAPAAPAGRRAPVGAGDVYPVPPGGYDRLRHARVVAEFDRGDDPWLDEWLDGGWEGPTAEDGEEPEPPPVTAEDDPAAGLEWHPAARVPQVLPADVEGMPGGAGLAGALAGAELPRLGAYELVEYVAACERVAATVLAWQAAAIAELAGRVEMRPQVDSRARERAPVVSPQRATAVEVAARLRMAARDADALVARAGYLTSVLADTYAAWAAGWLSTEKADLIGRLLCRHDDELARAVEAAVLPRAAGLTVESLRRLINRTVHRLDPGGAEARRRERKQDRFVRITPVDDGMAWIEAYVSAEDAAAVEAVLSAGAATLTRDDPDGGGRTARRADVLTRLAWAALGAGRIGGCTRCGHGLGLADAQGRPVTVNITIPLSGLSGGDGQRGELAGFGPVTADTVAGLLGQATVRRLVTDPVSGALLDVGRTRYRPPAALAEHILLRDVTCVWPGCDRPATGGGIDIDHTVPASRGGPTAHHNLGAYCEHHHTVKDNTGWSVAQPEPGRFAYRSPTGHTYTREPEPVGPV